MSEGIAVSGRRAYTHSTTQCRHHWVIETPNGATSLGVCKRCGRRKRYPNAAADAVRETGGARLGRWSRARGRAGPRQPSQKHSESEGY